MSEMTTNTNTTSDDTLIRDSQLSGFASFKEHLAFCCCRLLKKSHQYDLSTVSKSSEELQDKPSYVNQAFQREKQARKEKLDKIARTLPTPSTSSSLNVSHEGIGRINPSTQTSTRSLTTITQGTPRSIGPLPQTRSPMNLSNSKTNFSKVTKPSPLSVNRKEEKKETDQTSTDQSSEEETSSDDDQSTDSDRKSPKKKSPIKQTNPRR